MALIAWGPALSVGVKEIDDQHKKLVDMVNQLNDAMSQGQGRQALGKVLNDLISYTQFHFRAEEKLMETNGYAATAAHKGEHHKLVQDVSQFKSKFDSGNASISIELMTFLRNWLSNHILNSDKKVGQSLNQKGVK
jgi:hemerythrin